MKYNSKKEKAISYITEEIRSLELAPELNGCPMTPEWAEQLDIMRTCLEAVQEHFPDTTKMVKLTLEQLLELGEKAENGEKIIVYCTPLNEWCKVFKYGIMFFGTEYYRSWREVEETYERDWLAYAYHPAYIDLKKWEPCDQCKSCESCYKLDSFHCFECKEMSEFVPDSSFCGKCGRPRTLGAWAEMEKRMSG